MVIRKSQLFDFTVYLLFIIFTIYDFIANIDLSKSLFVYMTFGIIATLSICLFIKDDGFLTIDSLIYVFTYLFFYYAPLHQYNEGINIHKYSSYTMWNYASANLIIILFIIVYKLSRKYLNKQKSHLFKTHIVKLNQLSSLLLMIFSLLALFYLYKTHNLFSLSDVTSTTGDESITKVILKIIRYIPISSLLMYIYLCQIEMVVLSKKWRILFIAIVGFCCMIIFFPLNGTIGRFLLFGTYISIVGSIFDDYKHKSVIVLVAFLGFYYIFPAMNFFKNHTLSDISSFVLGGFDAGFIDYDAYQLLMQTMIYVKDNGLTFGANIISALLCIIPRSIWKGKLEPSGAIVSGSYNAVFTNVSCPLPAEFYLSFGILGIVVLTVLFSKLIGYIENAKQRNNVLLRGYYYIFVGIIISYMRGAMLPVTSFLYSLFIAYTLVYLVCKICR